MARTSDPYRIKLSKTEEQQFTNWLCDELQYAYDARQAEIGDGEAIDEWWSMYEQKSQGKAKSAWEDGADLTSYILTEKVDAIAARIVEVIFSDPLYVVEGFGPSAKRAPLVEEFTQMKVEDDRVQTVVEDAVLSALIERTAVIEVYEKAETRKVRKEIRCEVERAEDGTVKLNERNQPIPLRDANGVLVEFQGDEDDEGAAFADVVIDETQRLRSGPCHEVLSMKEFLFLPGHAKNMGKVWGFAKRFYRRVPELRLREKEGYYFNIKKLGDDGEREATSQEASRGMQIAPQDGPTAEKELWEVLLQHDVDGDGIEEWIVATVSLRNRVLIGLRHDELEQVRYVPITPFPDPKNVYGFSFAGDKLWTHALEHTAIRNTNADLSALAAAAPMMKTRNETWNPSAQPLGVGKVVTVSSLANIKRMEVPDVPASSIERERNVMDAAERVAGGSDTALSGVSAQSARTATEISAVARGTAIRVNKPIKRVQEALEDLAILRHRLWVLALEAREQYQPKDQKGLEPTPSAIKGLQTRGLDEGVFDNPDDFRFTAAMLKGRWRFKPRGSVDTADPYRQRADFNELLGMIGQLGQMFPVVQEIMKAPEAGRALLEHGLRLHRVRDLQAIVGSAVQRLAKPGPPAPGAVLDANAPPAAEPGGGSEDLAGLMRQVEQMVGAGAPPAAGL